MPTRDADPARRGLDQPASQQQRRISVVFDAVVAVLGFVALVAAVLSIGRRDGWNDSVGLALLLAAPLLVVIQRFEVSLALTSASPNAPVVAFDSFVLLVLGCGFAGDVALLGWAGGQLLANLLDDVTPAVRRFNIGLMTLAATAGILVMHAFGPLEGRLLTGAGVAAVTLGWLAYLATFYLVLLASLRLEAGEPLWQIVHPRQLLVTLALHVPVDGLGFLTVLLATELAGWTVLLALAPLVAILVGSTALSRAAEHQHRLSVLFAAAKEIQLIETHEGIVAALARRAPEVVGTGGAALRGYPPVAPEIGAQVRNAREALWLVAPGVNRGRGRRTADHDALAALATVGEEALLRAALADEMHRMAHTDALTRLVNRALFIDRVGAAIEAGGPDAAPPAVMFLDLDRFKAINDRFGHGAGDDLLVEVARRLGASVREPDLVARLGGDEFAILIAQHDGAGELTRLATRLIGALQAPIRLGEHTAEVGTSVGIAIAAPGGTAEQTIREADLAMYEAKRLGSNRFRLVHGVPSADVVCDPLAS